MGDTDITTGVQKLALQTESLDFSQSGTLNTSNGLTPSGGDVRPVRRKFKRRIPPVYGRTCLPSKSTRGDFRVWSFLKTCIGKELSKITMPVVFNEPLSFLQRLTEYMEYSYLLQTANNSSDPLERIEYVTAFAVSALACNWERLGKPFNPLLGETYELERDNFRLVAEQVSHHPPVSAFHAESPDFVFHGSIYPKLKFWGKSVEIMPKGTLTVELPRHKEAYTWSNINCCVHNVIVGNLWIEQYGLMEIINHNTGHKVSLNFKPAGWFNRELHRLEGFVYDSNKKKLRYLYGKWTEVFKSVSFSSYEVFLKSNPSKLKAQDSVANEKSPKGTPSASPAHHKRSGLSKLNSITGVFTSFSSSSHPTDAANGHEVGDLDEGEEDIPRSDSTFSLDIPDSTTLWHVEPRPENTAEYFQFTSFSMALNELLPGMDSKLAPTDSRLRPDMRLLEQGDLDGASAAKTRLEEKQREVRKQWKKTKDKETWSPLWFESQPNPYTKSEDWIFTGKYWNRDFSNSANIF